MIAFGSYYIVSVNVGLKNGFKLWSKNKSLLFVSFAFVIINKIINNVGLILFCQIYVATNFLSH